MSVMSEAWLPAEAQISRCGEWQEEEWSREGEWEVSGKGGNGKEVDPKS